MYKFLKIAVAAAAFLISTYAAKAQTPPLPPSVIVNGNIMTGSSGSYSTNNYGGNGVSASLTIGSWTGTYSPFSCSLGVGSGYWTPSYIITPGYWVSDYYVSGYTIPGYWIAGYWSDGSANGGYYDESGNWFQTGWWNDPVWVPDQMVGGYDVPGYWVPDQWSTPSWVSTEVDDSGQYSHFSFSGTINGTSVQPADSVGTAWANTPKSGIPAVWVNKALYQFSASDVAAGYDYYINAGGSGYVWILPGSYGGYDPVRNVTFGGGNSNGYFQDNTNTGVSMVPRNGDGSFLSFGSPTYGPPAIWSNGLAFRFLTTDATNARDVYLEDTDDVYVFVGSTGTVAEMAVGSYANQGFQATPAPTFAANLDGTALPAGSSPQWGPPAIYVADAVWGYRGSTGGLDYYGGPRLGEILSIASDGAVSYSDRSLNILNVAGYYAGGAFQNLPVIVRGVTSNGSPWTALSSSSGDPAAITVDGHPWYYSAAMSSSGITAYVGPWSGQTMYINNSTGAAVITDPTTGTWNVSGAFGNGQFTFASNPINVETANADGTPVNAAGSSNNIVGNLDVSGNFTMGNWQNGTGPSLNGFGLTFTAPSTGYAAQIQFGSTVSLTNWLWSNAATDGGNQQVSAMMLDSTNRLMLFAPGYGTTPTIVLDPVGLSQFNGPIRIAPQGDISMGQFTYDPASP